MHMYIHMYIHIYTCLYTYRKKCKDIQIYVCMYTCRAHTYSFRNDRLIKAG